MSWYVCVCVRAGEYIAAEKIEAAYKKNGMVEQIWVYGNSLESTLVAIVVPTGQPCCCSCCLYFNQTRGQGKSAGRIPNPCLEHECGRAAGVPHSLSNSIQLEQPSCRWLQLRGEVSGGGELMCGLQPQA